MNLAPMKSRKVKSTPLAVDPGAVGASLWPHVPALPSEVMRFPRARCLWTLDRLKPGRDWRAGPGLNPKDGLHIHTP